MRTAAKQPVDAMPSAPADASLPTATQWDLHELELLDDASSLPDNPFDVELFAVFTLDGGSHKPVQVRGFHDGGATFRVRFCRRGRRVAVRDAPDRPALSNRRGGLRVAARRPARAGARAAGRSFVHADGSAHFSVGTTSYAWIHQGDATIRHTIQTLRDGPFNKLRMTLLPKWYQYNHVEPRHFPHEGSRGHFVKTRFNVTFWRRLDARLRELLAVGVQVHDATPRTTTHHPHAAPTLTPPTRTGRPHPLPPVRRGPLGPRLHGRHRPGLVRHGARRGVPAVRRRPPRRLPPRVVVDGERVGPGRVQGQGAAAARRLGAHQIRDVVAGVGPTLRDARLRGPVRPFVVDHNQYLNYDHSKPWVTHISAQGEVRYVLPPVNTNAHVGWYDVGHTKRHFPTRPIVWDEVMYEGDVPFWGGLTAAQMADRFWWGLAHGVYVGHGETLTAGGRCYDDDACVDDDDHAFWWSKGGTLRGESPSRIRWFRTLAARLFDDVSCTCSAWGGVGSAAVCDDGCGNSKPGDMSRSPPTTPPSSCSTPPTRTPAPPRPPTSVELPPGSGASSRSTSWRCACSRRRHHAAAAASRCAAPASPAGLTTAAMRVPCNK